MSENIKYTVEKEYIKIWFEGSIQVDSITDLISEIAGIRDELPCRLKVLIDSRRAKQAAAAWLK